MARAIDPDDLKPQDKSYLLQRPWLIGELEIETGKKFEDLDFGLPDEPEDPQEAAALSEEQELLFLRRKNGELSAKVEELQEDLTQIRAQLADFATKPDSEDEEEVDPYEQWDYDDLIDEAKRRNLDLPSRKKEDVVKALEDDDNSAASREE